MVTILAKDEGELQIFENDDTTSSFSKDTGLRHAYHRWCQTMRDRIFILWLVNACKLSQKYFELQRTMLLVFLPRKNVTGQSNGQNLF